MRIGNYLPGQQPNKRQDGINRALAKRLDRVLEVENGGTGTGGSATVINNNAAASGGGNGGNSYVTQSEVYNIINQYITNELINPALPEPPVISVNYNNNFAMLYLYPGNMTVYPNTVTDVVVMGFDSAINNGIDADISTGMFTVAKDGYYKITFTAQPDQPSSAFYPVYRVYVDGNVSYLFSGINTFSTFFVSVIIPDKILSSSTVSLQVRFIVGTTEAITFTNPILSLEYSGCPI